MEDPYTEWRAEDYTSDDGSGKMGWMWNKGVGLGKKIVVAGFVASSAPLVLPPLLVASTIAVLSSVPYGLFLASYACTEKLMSKLLPPSTPSPYGQIYDGTGDVMEDYRGLEKYADENVEGNKYWDIDQGIYEDEADVEEIGFEDEGVRDLDVEEPGSVLVMDDQPVSEVIAVSVSIQEDEDTFGNVEAKETPFEVTNVAVEVFQRPSVKEDEELVRKKEALIEKIRDESRSDELVAGERGGGTISRKERKGTMEGTEKVDTNSADGRGKLMPKNKETQEIGQVEKMVIGSIDGNKQISETKLDTHEGKPERKSVPISSGKDIKPASDEVLYVEEKVWEKIDAMRAIVGYKVARSKTCIEELKALYLFTGVEPPASFKDTSDIIEVNDKLRFLMSVVGVK